ncbi:MFS transporter [Actinomadura harenae]|uniref:MFS transporter n=1 Tax=Actinomadura harenae TaxID=2483351 RepID=A0A3M2M0Y8_9ACTN|nr:MFS transporter [Actinomadura harenae]RMI43349.1 MFS transporter [Actinomadura harenae]
MPTTTPDPRRWLILAVLCLSLLVVVIDNTVLTVAIPSLIRDLGASNADIQWILDAYILVFAGLLLTAGALSDRYGRRLGLITGLILFGGASGLAAYAGDPTELITARALMGIGGAFLMPGTLSILTTVFDDDERKKAIAIWSSALMVGALGAPVAGGLLLQHYWWGSVFLINIPVAILGVIAALIVIPESRGPANRPDLPGALLSTTGMTALVWAVINIARHGWTAPTVLIGFALAALGLTGFALWERHTPHPMLPIALFANRNFTGASLSIVLMSLSAGGLTLALTQYLQFVLDYTPLKTGLAFMPMLVTVIAFNGIGVALDRKLGTRAALATGLLLLAAGFGLLALIRPGDGYPHLVAALMVMGAGSGTAGPAAYGTLLAALPKDRAGVGSAVNDTVQQIGQALSVAILGTVLTTAYSRNLPDTITGPARESLGDALALATRTHDTALAHTARDAFVHAMTTIAIVGVLGGIAAAAVAYTVLRRPTPQPATDPDAGEPGEQTTAPEPTPSTTE